MSSPVIVAGAGPAGLTLAGELALAGAPVVVLDRLPAADPHAPGQAVNAATVELLDQRGLLDDLRADAIPLPGAHYALLWLHPQRLAGPREHGLIVPQTRLEAALAERLTASGVEIRRGHGLTGLRQDAGGVTARISGPDGPYELRGSYLVGADGQDSTVRRLAKIAFPGGDWALSGLVADVETDFAALAPEHLGARLTEAGAMYSACPAGPGVLRVITATATATATGRARGAVRAPATLEELQREITRLTGWPLPAGALRWAERFTSTSGNAERYRDGRVFLVGDAAHTFCPLGGLRINTAVHDAVNLGWKLAADLNGWAPPGLLDTYHDERHPAGARAVRALDAQLALVQGPEHVGALRDLLTDLIGLDDVNRYLLELVTGTDVRHPSPVDGHPLVGRRLPNLPLVTTDGARTTTAALQRRARGILLRPGGDGRRHHDGAHRWSDRVDTVSARPTPELTAATGGAAVLLRPDGHIAWTDPAAAPATAPAPGGGPALAEALRAWFGDPR
ncbi:FAD-dependent monooxygenase [Kitasatospora sp. NPDC056184]|uniref:FAD-dependent monooxygenase n=1 Tax=Kitasatospora sp. NPDC056184 TaxID=3345738 RepID=UPI0035DF3EE7